MLLPKDACQLIEVFEPSMCTSGLDLDFVNSVYVWPSTPKIRTFSCSGDGDIRGVMKEERSFERLWYKDLGRFRAWNGVLKKVGKDAMHEILSKRCLFRRIPSPSGFLFLQICGEFGVLQENSRKQQVIDHKVQQGDVKRERMFYGCKSIVRIRLTPEELVRQSFYGGRQMISKSAMKTSRYEQCLSLCKLLLRNMRRLRQFMLLNYHCPVKTQTLVEASTDQVKGFLFAAVKRILPKEMHGVYLEFLKVLLDQLVCLNSQSRIYVDQIFAGMPLRGVRWFSKGSSSGFTSKQEHEILREGVLNFTRWFINQVCIPLVRSCFYVTLAAESRYRLHYYRHECWKQATRVHTNVLLKRMYELEGEDKPAYRVSLPQMPFGNVHVLDDERRDTAASPIRLVPKANGKLRPLVNIRRKYLHGRLERHKTSQSIYNLKDVLLSFHKTLHIGYSLLGMDEAHQGLSKFNPIHGDQEIYLLKADITSCFDSIPQERLLDVIYELLGKRDWCIKCFRIQKGFHRIITKSMAYPCTEKDQEPSDECIGKRFNHGIIKEAQGKKMLLNETLRVTLRNHILHSCIVHEGKIYRQRHGISQGSPLSNILVALFYGHLDGMQLSRWGEVPGTTILRYTDDILLMTQHRFIFDAMSRFLNEGCPEYGIVFNKAKCRVNKLGNKSDSKVMSESDGDDALIVEENDPLFPWIGIAIQSKPVLAYFADKARVHEVRQADCLKLPRHSNRIQQLEMILSRLTSHRQRSLYLANRINIMDNLILLYMRAVCFWRQWARFGQRHAWIEIEGVVDSVFLAFSRKVSTSVSGMDLRRMKYEARNLVLYGKTCTFEHLLDPKQVIF